MRNLISYMSGFQQNRLLRCQTQEKEYPAVCFNYIHENPVKAKLVKKSEDWMFSSFRDYQGLSDDILVSLQRAKELGLI